MFKDARNDAEERIYSQINEKIDSFFELGKLGGTVYNLLSY